ncbi:MAG TPA: DUF2782 domain-containing protein [Noviherbaspirillum sp.]|uniref:DUF2782 domain-containing protein n=1 Tax=Noviherbaspirillum sp. TaxID=1926288 RepID=UPI002D4384C3|nr:DUF2782 domain-containing protein [Noviherbaspirillum sp.]HYD96385.1 DUF2782 domain-containing protein [Noviherbaspirillum sp.]
MTFLNKARHAALACIAIQATTLAAFAQQPPQLESLDEGEAPAVTIRKPDQKSRIEENRTPGGKVTAIRVSTGGSTYVVRANDQAGSAAAGDLQGHAIRAAQWEVKEFNLGRPTAREQEEAQAAAPAPPPPPPPAQK